MSRRADSAPGALDSRLRTSLVAVALTGFLLTLMALAVSDFAAALSAAVGAGLAAANLWALARVVGALLPTDRPGAEAQSRGGWALVAALKMFGLVAVVWLLMRRGFVSPLPMLVGFGALPIGIAIGSLVSDRSAQTDER